MILTPASQKPTLGVRGRVAGALVGGGGLSSAAAAARAVPAPVAARARALRAQPRRLAVRQGAVRAVLLFWHTFNPFNT
jgi:hypothetical protein